MFNIFKQLKQLKMTKQELEQENIAMKQALDRANLANSELSNTMKQMAEDLNNAINRVRYLDSQIKMADMQKQAASKYSDNNKNY